MKTTNTTIGVPSATDAELQEAILRAISPLRDPNVMRKAAEAMDRIGEEIRKRHGVLDIGVPAIRELRGELPNGLAMSQHSYS